MLSSQESNIAASHAVSFGHVLKVSNSQQKSQDSHAPLSIYSGFSLTDSECLVHKLYFTCCDEHLIAEREIPSFNEDELFSDEFFVLRF